MSDDPSKTKLDLAALDDIASVHVVRLLNGADDAERRAIEDWIDADPRHAVAFARMQAAWEASERLNASPPAMDAATTQGAAAWPARRGFIGGLVAACAVGGVVTGAWLHARDLKLYRTGIGERRTVRLEDGSSVEMNTASTIEVAMRRQRRDVRLVKGEALFTVAHDSARPFYVTAGSARFKAVGTAFNVRIRSQVVELTVTQGVVAVASIEGHDQGLAAPHIAAGHGAVVDGDAVAPTALGGDALRQRTAWQSGVLEFNGETLAQAVEELNRYQRHPIVIGDSRIADIRIGGRFQVNEADQFLTAVSSSFPVDVRRTEDGGVLLTARSEKSSDPG